MQTGKTFAHYTKQACNSIFGTHDSADMSPGAALYIVFWQVRGMARTCHSSII